MAASPIYIVITIVVLIVVAILAFILGRREPHNRLTPLAGLAFAFVVAGIFFAGNRPAGYGLMGIGVILAVIDIFRRPK